MDIQLYTTLLEKKQKHLSEHNISSDDLLKYMSEAFRSFSDAINVFLIKNTDYSGDISSVKERTDYLYSKYNSIGYMINPANIKNWLSGKAPAYTSESREKMYALCFALNFDLDTTKEFFQKVYFDRCFDCHNIQEAIYYYCMKNSLSYSNAKNLIEQANNMSNSKIASRASQTILYTHIIQQKIDSIHKDDELLSYIQNNSDSFNIIHASAKKQFYSLIDNLLATRSDADYIAANPQSVKDYSNNRPIKALTTLEYYKYNTEDNPLLQIYSDEFMINQILDNREHERALSKNISLPTTLKSSFPNRHVINDIRLGFDGKKKLKNDALRKTIILLFFYQFWCEQDLNINPIDDEEERKETFGIEINDCLTSCGYEPLYIGNPYDWIFIYSAKCDLPLDTFRDIYSSLIYYEVE